MPIYCPNTSIGIVRERILLQEVPESNNAGLGILGQVGRKGVETPLAEGVYGEVFEGLISLENRDHLADGAIGKDGESDFDHGLFVETVRILRQDFVENLAR